MCLKHFLKILVLIKSLDVSLCNSEIQTIPSPADYQFTPTHLMDVVHILNKNGHSNLIYASLDYNDEELNNALSELSYSWPRKTGVPPRRCFTEECYYINWFKISPSVPIIYMLDDDIKMDKENTMVFLVSSLNSSHWKFYLNEIAERKLSSTVRNRLFTYNYVL